MMNNADLSRRAWPLLVLALAPALWHWPLLAGRLPDFMDTVTQLYPYRVAAARQLRKGTLPLWLPNQMGGMPLAANPQVSTWYPPQFLFYLLPGPVGNGLVVLLHYVAAGLGAFLFLRHLGARRPEASYAGLTFQFGALLVSRIALTPHLYTCAWIPWILLGIERSLRARSSLAPNGGVLLVAAAAALQVLAGSPQITYYTALATAVYWIARAFSLSPRRVPSALAHGAVAAALAFLLSAIQLLPSAEFAAAAERSTIALDRLREQALNGPMLWRALVGFTAPVIEDTDTINAIGIGALLLVPLACAGKRRRGAAISLLLVGAMVYVLAIGALAPAWAEVLPLYESFHAPRRALVLWSVVGPLLAGLGAARLHAFSRKKKLPRWSFPATLALLFVGTAWMLPRLERESTTPERFDPDPRVVAALGDSRFVALDPTLAYSYDSRRPDYGLSLMPDLASWHDLHDAQGYDPLVLKSAARARDAACSGSGVFYPSHGLFLSNINSPVLRLLAVQHVIGRFDLYDPSRVIPGARFDAAAAADAVELVVDDERWPLHRFREDRPLAWLPPRVVAAPDPLGMWLVRGDYSLAATEDLALSVPEAPAVEAAWQDARTLRLSVPTPLAADALVCVAIPWTSGWTARDQAGAPLELLPANGVITGVLAPPGTAAVILRYAPRSFTTGALLTLGGLVLLLALGLRLRGPRLPTPKD